MVEVQSETVSIAAIGYSNEALARWVHLSQLSRAAVKDLIEAIDVG